MNSTSPTSDQSTSPPQKPLSVWLDEMQQVQAPYNDIATELLIRRLFQVLRFLWQEFDLYLSADPELIEITQRYLVQLLTSPPEKTSK